MPISFGGNKARKAELFFRDIERKNVNCIVTYGSSYSNHCRVISNLAKSKGLPCYIISPYETKRESINNKLINFFDAKFIFCPINQVSETINCTIDELNKKGDNPYFIEGGGHGNIGTHAYVEAYEEIRDFEKSNGVIFDYIFHASGTGTTQAGLVCGKLINGDNREIVGISIARKNPYGKKVVLDSVMSYFRTHGNLTAEEVEHEVNFVDDFVLEGYGSYNTNVLSTVREILLIDGIPLDTTYTGKAFWGMCEYIKKNRIKNSKILFIHTGGTPLFYDQLEELMNEC